MKIIPSLLTLALAVAPGVEMPAVEPPPNVVIYFVDDLGYGDLSCYGSRTISTPNLDRMAAEGLRCTDFYVASPVCTSSRASLITGQLPNRVGAQGALTPNATKGLEARHETISSVSRARGYATAMIGKWHLGHQPAFLPMAHGFELFFGTPYSNNMGLAKDLPLAAGVTPGKMKAGGGGNAPLMRQGEVIEAPPDHSQSTRRYTEEALRFIGANQARPFFLYIAPNMPHAPVTASAAFLDKSKAGRYGDSIQELDWSVGQILSGLRKAKVDHRTLVVFASDNGPERDQASAGSAGPLRGYKHTYFEGGVRVPAIFWWPKRIPPGESAQILSTLDLMPTIARLIGAPPPKETDGVDIRSALFGKDRKTPLRDHLVWPGKAVRSGDWKLVIDGGQPALFNLVQDVGEATDLSSTEAAHVARLRGLLNARQ